MKREVERRGVEDVVREEERRKEEEARALEDFEKVSTGLEEIERPKKRKAFELDSDAASAGEKAEREKPRRRIDEEKASGSTLPSFWIPSLTPSMDTKSSSTLIPSKLHPLCPASQPHTKHPLSLKSLTIVRFSRGDKSSTAAKDNSPPACPSCTKPLSNTSCAVLVIPCGHVICKACAGQFMTPEVADPHATANGAVAVGRIFCYVCETDVTPGIPPEESEKTEDGGEKKKKKKQRRKGEFPKRGLVELKSDGTGFAGGGKNIVGKEGVVFQC